MMWRNGPCCRKLPRAAVLPAAVERFIEGCVEPVSPLEEQQLLRRAHEVAHEGVAAMVARITNAGYYWPKLRADATALLSECMPCIRFNVGKKGYHPAGSLAADVPMQHVVMDLFGPLVSSTSGSGEGFTYVLVAVDVASRFTFLRPLRDKSAVSVAAVALQIEADFGRIGTLSSDNGTEFANSLMEEVCDIMGTARGFSLPYYPQGNGLAERAVGTFSRLLKKWLEGDLETWAPLLPAAQVALNTRVAQTHGSTPFAAMFLRKCTDPLSAIGREKPLQYSADDGTADQSMTSETLATRLALAAEVVFPQISKKADDAAAARKARLDARAGVGQEVIAEGTKVMVKNVVRAGKFEPFREGPYVVMSSSLQDGYVLSDATGKRLARKVPRQHLTVVSDRVPFGSSDVVSSVVAHEGDGKQRRYRVRWKGFGEEDDTWEPVDHFDDLAPIVAYWKGADRSSGHGGTGYAAAGDSLSNYPDPELIVREERENCEVMNAGYDGQPFRGAVAGPDELLEAAEVFRPVCPADISGSVLRGRVVIRRVGPSAWARATVTKSYEVGKSRGGYTHEARFADGKLRDVRLLSEQYGVRGKELHSDAWCVVASLA